MTFTATPTVIEIVNKTKSVISMIGDNGTPSITLSANYSPGYDVTLDVKRVIFNASLLQALASNVDSGLVTVLYLGSALTAKEVIDLQYTVTTPSP